MQPIRFELKYRLPGPPERVWPILADTERLNRGLGLPPTVPEPAGEEPVRVIRVRASLLGIPLEWDEEPFEFVEPRSYWVRRRMLRGPIRDFNGGARFEPCGGETEIRVEAEFVPAGPAGQALIHGMWAKTRREWDRLVRQVGDHLRGESPSAFGVGVDLQPPNSRAATLQTLERADPDLCAAPLAPRLFEHVASAGETELLRMRPFALARLWGEERYEVLRLFLQAAKSGVLDLAWELVCPNCRGGKARWTTLDQVRDRAHCDDCQISFDANFDRALEVVFRPNAAYRRVEGVQYCSAGPRNTPHVAAQTVLAPGETREWHLALAAGRYRLRNLTASLAASVYAAEGGAGSLDAALAPEGIEVAPGGPAGTGEVRLRLENRTASRQQVILERMALYEEIATAAEVTIFQEFRDLFGKEVLSPAVRLGIETLPLMFTDLKGSTALYASLGDASAYGLVRDHFRMLRELVARHGGGLVKTIGDSVMAAFPTARAAIACALEIHERLAEFNREAVQPVRLKIGLHQGPCIAVASYDERLDYFGTTVNLAARTHEQSRGDDLVVTEAMLSDPTVAELLEGVRCEPFSAELRGIGEARLYRLLRGP